MGSSGGTVPTQVDTQVQCSGHTARTFRTLIHQLPMSQGRTVHAAWRNSICSCRAPFNNIDWRGAATVILKISRQEIMWIF